MLQYRLLIKVFLILELIQLIDAGSFCSINFFSLDIPECPNGETGSSVNVKEKLGTNSDYQKLSFGFWHKTTNLPSNTNYLLTLAKTQNDWYNQTNQFVTIFIKRADMIPQVRVQKQQKAENYENLLANNFPAIASAWIHYTFTIDYVNRQLGFYTWKFADMQDSYKTKTFTTSGTVKISNQNSAYFGYPITNDTYGPVCGAFGFGFGIKDYILTTQQIEVLRHGYTRYGKEPWVMYLFEAYSDPGIKDHSPYNFPNYQNDILLTQDLEPYALFKETSSLNGDINYNAPTSMTFWFKVAINFAKSPVCNIFSLYRDDVVIYSLKRVSSMILFTSSSGNTFIPIETLGNNATNDIIISHHHDPQQEQGYVRIYLNSTLKYNKIDNTSTSTPSTSNNFSYIIGADPIEGAISCEMAMYYFIMAPGFGPLVASSGDKCIDNCYSELTPGLCSKCLSGYHFLLPNRTCTTLTNVQGYYPHRELIQTSICLNGHPGGEDFYCPTCSDENCLACPEDASNCTICYTGYELNTKWSCDRKCHIACKICTSKSQNACTSCENGYYLDGKTCDTTCPKGKFANTTTNTCDACDESCKECADRPKGCTVCAEGYFRTPKLVNGQNCVKVCPVMYYAEESTKTCEPCDPACTVCQGPSDSTCSSCVSSAWLLLPSKCVFECPDGYYGDSSTNQCKACHSSCATCTGGTAFNCKTCSDPSQFVYNGKCISCHPSCLRCRWEGPNGCLSCYRGYGLQNGACLPLDCKSGHYPNSDLNRCDPCPPECKECMSPDECTECNRGYLLINKKCEVCDKKRGYANISGDCQEICGDGIRLGGRQCDDGNTLNGDGCSSECEIENGWKCSGGTPYTPDKCEKLSNINLEAIPIADVPQTKLKFTSDVVVLGDWREIIAIYSLSLLQFFEDFSIIRKSGNEFILNLENFPASSPTEVFEIRIIRPHLLLDAQKGVPVTFSAKSITLDFSSKFQSGVAGQTARTFMATTTAALGTSFITLAVTGSAKLVMKMVDSLQIIPLLPLLSINFPSFTIDLFKIVKFATFGWIPNLFEIIGNAIDLDMSNQYQIPPPKFLENGFKTQFLLNSGRFICLGVTLVLVSLGLKPFSRSKNPLIQKVIGVLTPSTMIKTFITAYNLILIGSLLQVINTDFRTGFTIASSIIAIVSLGVLVFLPLMLYNFTQKNERFFSDKAFIQRYGAIYLEYDEKNFWGRNFIVFNLIYKALFALSLVCFNKMPYLQVTGILLSKVLMVGTLILTKPYKTQRENITQIVIEIFLTLLLSSILFYLIEKGPANTRAGGFFSTMIQVVLIIILAINLGLSLHTQYKTIKAICKTEKKIPIRSLKEIRRPYKIQKAAVIKSKPIARTYIRR